MRKMFMAVALAMIGLSGIGQALAQSSTLKPEELDQLVAPIALYPDTLLSQVLIASTYPLEVVEAERWAEQNKNLKGDALKKAVDPKKWDDSIKSLAAVPDVLKMMSDKLDWTQKLGDAVLAQQPDVMDAIQRLRQKAQANDKLKTNKQQKVTTTSQGSQNYIAIEPSEPNTVYVPYYDPAVVYGAWPYPSYPPYYFPTPGYIAGGLIATGVAFGVGYAVGAWTRGGNYWGGGFNWGNRNINVNNNVNININNRNTWVHNSDHRHGVRYNNDNVKQKFAKGDNRGDIRGKDQRMDFRGRDGQQVLKPGSDRPGNRPGGDRPDGRPDRDGPGKDARPGGDRQKPGGDRPQARPGGDRPGGGDRPRPQPKGPQHGGGFDKIDRGGLERAASNRGHASLGDHGGGRPNIGGGGGGRPHVGGGGGGGRQFGGGGGGGGRVGGGGGRGGGGRGGGGRR
jgi:Protein of unknown function (DUF3300)